MNLFVNICLSSFDDTDSTANAAKSKFERFEKMRKLLPEGAVRQKMTMEGFSKEEVDGFFSEKAKAVEDYANYLLNTCGPKEAAKAGYVPLGGKILKVAKAQAAKISN